VTCLDWIDGGKDMATDKERKVVRKRRSEAILSGRPRLGIVKGKELL
jgi:hypothetical protein